jgi:hypothetical protein
MPPAPRRVENEEAPQAWAMTMLGRPLFRKDRRPEQPAADHGARTDARARLTGVVIGPFGKRAIFRSGENTKSIVVQEGAQVGDFVIRSIEPGRAVIESNGDLQILTPSFADGRAPQRR